MRADLEVVATKLARGIRRLPGQRRASSGANLDPGAPRRRWLMRRVLLGAGALMFAAIGWVVVTALLAGHQLQALRSDVPTLRGQLAAAQYPAARSTAQDVGRRALRSYRLTSGPVWALAERIPVLGGPLRTTRGIARIGHELADAALRPLSDAARRLGADGLRQPDGRIDLAAIRALQPTVAAATEAVGHGAAIAAALPRHTWLPQVDRARTELAGALARLAPIGAQASDVLRLLPPLLGADHPRTYFVAFQNNAEARGTGGLPGAFAILTASDGRVRFDNFYSDDAINGTAADVELGPDYDSLWRPSGTESLYVNSNLGPNFPDAAQIWASMWQRRTGQRVDGAMAVDPQVLSYLLAATGPARLPDGTTVSAANIVQLTENTAYLRFGADTRGRKTFLIEVARAVAEKITAAHPDSTRLVAAVLRAARERRLLVWSADPTVQTRLDALPVSGTVPRTDAPYAGLTVVNDGGNKLDFYLDRSMTWDARECRDTRDVTVTVDLRNSVPADMTSPYLTARSDRHEYPVVPGDNRVLVYYAATQGAVLRSASLDGAPEFVASGTEHGHPVFGFDLELPRGQDRRLVLRLTEPASPGALVAPVQPLVRPMRMTVHRGVCR